MEHHIQATDLREESAHVLTEISSEVDTFRPRISYASVNDPGGKYVKDVPIVAPFNHRTRLKSISSF